MKGNHYLDERQLLTDLGTSGSTAEDFITQAFIKYFQASYPLQNDPSDLADWQRYLTEKLNNDHPELVDTINSLHPPTQDLDQSTFKRLFEFTIETKKEFFRMSEAKVEINKIIDGSEAFRTFINLQLRKTGEFDTDQDVTAENCTQRKEQIQTYRTLFDKLTAAKEALKTLLDERLEHSFKLLEFTGTEDKDKSLAHLMNELDPIFGV